MDHLTRASFWAKVSITVIFGLVLWVLYDVSVAATGACA